MNTPVRKKRKSEDGMQENPRPLPAHALPSTSQGGESGYVGGTSSWSAHVHSNSSLDEEADYLLTPPKLPRRDRGDRFLLSDLDPSTLQLLLDLEGDSSVDDDLMELEQVPVIDISGFAEPDHLPQPPLRSSPAIPMPPVANSPEFFHSLTLPPPLSQESPLQPPSPMSLPPLSPPPPPSLPLPQTSSPPSSPPPPSTPNWSPDPPLTRPSIPFTGDSTLKKIPDGSDPHNFFDLIFTEEFFNLLVREVNDFACELFCQKIQEQIERKERGLSELKNPRIYQWRDVSLEEMKKWLGLFFMMGIVKVDRYKDYWARDEKFDFTFFSSHMSRNRWFAILEALHFAQNEPSTDPIYKIRPLVSFFHDRMAEIINPAKNVCLDESLAPWRGRLSFRQYIPLKSHKYGIKIYMLTEPDGLIHRFLVYAGAGDDAVRGVGHTTKVVHKLITGLYGEGRSLFMDNFYNSVALATDLLTKGTHVTGTLRANRKNNPPDLGPLKLKRGESAQRWSQEGVYVAKWKDKRDVWTISTEFSGDIVTTPARRGTVQKPESVVHYNKYMGGVDLVDQHLSYYTAPHRSVKWYKKFGLHLHEIMFLNTYFLYRRFSASSLKLDLYQFRLSIVDYLCGPFPTPKPSGPLKLPTNGEVIVTKHFPSLQPISSEPKARRKQLRCRLCYSDRKIVKQTTVFCPGCPTQPGLCLEKCFIDFHRSLGVEII